MSMKMTKYSRSLLAQAGDTLREAELPKVTVTTQAAQKNLRPTKCLKETLFNLLSCLRAVQCAAGSQPCELSPMPGWVSGDIAVLASLLALLVASCSDSCKGAQ